MKKILEIEKVSKNFGGVLAVDNITLDVFTGQIQGVIGPNGAGKTTLFNLISGIYKPSSGKIIFENNDITGYPTYQINEKGLVRTFQNIRLFKDMNVLENVLVGRHSNEEETMLDAIFKTKKHVNENRENKKVALELLDRVGLYDMRYEKPSSLSYGLQRRLEIARALASEPKVLMLDEPAAGMNEHETIVLTDFIRSLVSEDMAIMLIEHDMKLVMHLCDDIYVINYGKEIAQGSPSEVRTNKAVIDAYLGEEDN
ncbi:MAG: ABC transporter ATP-binding protein [Tissierellia bacterium]|jgi:branched-chain amino acid transport system ATP-binding protein|nr:ABC transporter ATP-binding protein [Tissierellia bacterium]